MKKLPIVSALIVTLISLSSSDFFQTISIKKPRLRSIAQSDAFDTGYFYQTPARNGEQQINEIFLEEKTVSNTNHHLRSDIPPTNPFDGDTFVPNKNYLTTYYSHLSSNMPMNRLGICGYTGISMFLSFYDSFWNDDFIFEQFDSDPSSINGNNMYNSSTNAYESPGVWNNIDWSSPGIDDLINEIIDSGITNQQSTEFMEALDRKIMEQVYYQIDSGTFLGQLFQIGINNGSIQPHFYENEYHYANEGYVNGIGVNNTIMSSVLQDYIDDNSLLRGRISVVTSKMMNDSEAEKQRIRSEIVEIVRTGRPVLMGGNGVYYTSGDPVPHEFGHVVVAYDYDEDNDILYGNMGWSSPSTAYYNLDDYFNLRMSDYWALNISSYLPRKRTNNYIYTNEAAFFSPGTNELFNLIKPSDYGFPEFYGYGINPDNKTITLSDTGEIFYTNRLRCGFIEGTHINISTKRYNPGIAYLEYEFLRNIAGIEVQLSWWSPNEQVTSSNSEYMIEYLGQNNIYFESINLWNDVSLPTNRLTPEIVSTSFPLGTTTFRFYGVANNPLCDRNKGRLSINRLTVIYS